MKTAGTECSVGVINISAVYLEDPILKYWSRDKLPQLRFLENKCVMIAGFESLWKTAVMDSAITQKWKHKQTTMRAARV